MLDAGWRPAANFISNSLYKRRVGIYDESKSCTRPTHFPFAAKLTLNPSTKDASKQARQRSRQTSVVFEEMHFIIDLGQID